MCPHYWRLWLCRGIKWTIKTVKTTRFTNFICKICRIRKMNSWFTRCVRYYYTESHQFRKVCSLIACYCGHLISSINMNYIHSIFHFISYNAFIYAISLGLILFLLFSRTSHHSPRGTKEQYTIAHCEKFCCLRRHRPIRHCTTNLYRARDNPTIYRLPPPMEEGVTQE